MWKKRILVSLWIMIIGIIGVITIVNHKPYFVMGGSSSVSPLMADLMKKYPENHQTADFTYNSSGSDAAVVPVTNNIFGIGWLSKSYHKTNKNLISFVLSYDGMILVYNLPPTAFGSVNTRLNFTQPIVKEMYANNKTNVLWKDLFPKPPEPEAEKKISWIKPDYSKRVLIYSRENGSGTRDVFNEKVLDNKNANYPKAITVNSSSQMFGMAEGGVGYSSYSDSKLLTNPSKLLTNPNSSFKNVHIADWDGIAPDLKTISDNKYTLRRPFTGLINKNYHQITTLVKFLKFLFQVNNDIIQTAFSEDNFAQAPVSLNDGINNDLKEWLDKFPNL